MLVYSSYWTAVFILWDVHYCMDRIQYKNGWCETPLKSIGGQNFSGFLLTTLCMAKLLFRVTKKNNKARQWRKRQRTRKCLIQKQQKIMKMSAICRGCSFSCTALNVRSCGPVPSRMPLALSAARRVILTKCSCVTAAIEAIICTVWSHRWTEFLKEIGSVHSAHPRLWVRESGDKLQWICRVRWVNIKACCCKLIHDPICLFSQWILICVDRANISLYI